MSQRLQKLDGWNEESIAELLREAQKVFVRREEENKTKRQKPWYLQWKAQWTRDLRKGPQRVMEAHRGQHAIKNGGVAARTDEYTLEQLGATMV